MSQIGDILDAMAEALAARYPHRVVGRALKDFPDIQKCQPEDLRLGRYTLVSRGVEGLDGERYVDARLIGQGLTDSRDDQAQTETFELSMVDEIYRFFGEYLPIRVDIRRIDMSGQMDHPLAWVNAQLRIGPLDLHDANTADMGDFTHFHADHDIAATSDDYTQAQGELILSGTGAILGVTITEPGNGYTQPPEIHLYGPGSGAILIATISAGQVTGVTAVAGGSGYTTDTRIAFTYPPGGRIDAQDDVVLPGP
jgi:hypothetical protein